MPTDSSREPASSTTESSSATRRSTIVRSSSRPPRGGTAPSSNIRVGVEQLALRREPHVLRMAEPRPQLAQVESLRCGNHGAYEPVRGRDDQCLCHVTRGDAADQRLLAPVVVRRCGMSSYPTSSRSSPRVRSMVFETAGSFSGHCGGAIVAERRYGAIRASTDVLTEFLRVWRGFCG